MPQADLGRRRRSRPYRVIWDLLHTVDVAEHDHHPRRRQPARPALAVLGADRRRSPTSAGARPPSSATASAWRWAPSWPQPDKLCINVWGDAAIGFTGMDFETAVRERIPILSILLNNFSMAIELPVMPVATEKYRVDRHQRQLRRLGARPSAATASASPSPARSSRRSSAASSRRRTGTPALLEFITAKEIGSLALSEVGGRHPGGSGHAGRSCRACGAARAPR